MSNRANNIWAAAATGSPGTNIARQQQSRWTGVPNEAIKRLVEDKIGSMLEGISEATERQAAKQMRPFPHSSAIFERRLLRWIKLCDPCCMFLGEPRAK